MILSDLLVFELSWFHPISVHLLTGAFFILFLTESINFFTGKPEFFKVGSFLYLVISVLLMISAGSGLFAKSYATSSPTEVDDVFNYHQTLALLTLIFFVLAGYLRLSDYQKSKMTRISKLTYFVLLLSALSLTITALFGGRLVFHYGIGVNS